MRSAASRTVLGFTVLLSTFSACEGATGARKAAAPTLAPLMSCICTGGAWASCGNGAIGGAQGDLFVNLSPATAGTRFKANPNTGWTCVVPAATRGAGGPLGCYCKGLCGNGGVGADPNYFDLGLSQDRVNAGYGGGKPGNRTGWLCGKYRGTL